MLCWFLLHNEVSQLKVCVYYLPLGPPSSHHPTPLGYHKACELNFLAIQLIPANSLTRGSVHLSMPLSQPIPPSPSPTVSTSPFSSSSLYFCPANKFISTIFLDSTYVLIHSISIYDLLHSVQQVLGSFTSLQLTQMCSFLWLIKIKKKKTTPKGRIELILNRLFIFKMQKYTQRSKGQEF